MYIDYPKFIMMKKVLLTFGILSISAGATFSQSCCMKKASCDGMVAFASNQDFKDAHLAPEPFDYKEEKGKMISYNTPDGKTGSAFAVLSSAKTNKVVFVFHEWWGLNDYIKREAEMLQKELGNVDVYALDLYDGKVASTPDSAGKYMMGMNPERAVNIVKGLVTLTEKNPLNTKTEIATIGWCMGGSWSFQASLVAANEVKACVMYYGFPEKDKEKMKGLKTNILYIQALQDGFITKDAVDGFVKDLKSLGKNIVVKQYEAVHAFANPSNPKFDKTASADAHIYAIEHLKKGLSLK